LETGKFTNKIKHNELPNKFQELLLQLLLNYTVYTIQTKNIDDFHWGSVQD